MSSAVAPAVAPAGSPSSAAPCSSASRSRCSAAGRSRQTRACGRASHQARRRRPAAHRWNRPPKPPVRSGFMRAWIRTSQGWNRSVWQRTSQQSISTERHPCAMGARWERDASEMRARCERDGSEMGAR
eukprot:2248642-Prymnesium_polylepis.2